MTAAAGLPPQPPDLAAMKARQQAAWSSGDYAVVGTTLQIVGEHLCEALDLRSGQSVLDVAAGNGNATLAAARRWCDVDLDRLCPGAARARPRARRGRGLTHRVPGGRRRGAAVRRRQLRRRGLDLRRDVHARPGQGRGRTVARLQARRQDRPRQLDARRLHRPGVQDHRQAHAAAGRREVAGAVGHAARASPRCSAPQARRRSTSRRGNFMFRYRSAAALDGGVQDLLRAAAEDLRGARPGRRRQELHDDLLALDRASSTAPATAPWWSKCRKVFEPISTPACRTLLCVWDHPRA